MARDSVVGPVTKYDAQGNTVLTNRAVREELTRLDVAPIYEPPGVKVVIMAGGKGTRLHDVHGDLIPKPMVEVGGTPILEHIIAIYADQGYTDFIIAGGFQWDVIAEWRDFEAERMWTQYGIRQLDVVDTGLETQTGGRLRRLQDLLGGDYFLMTYGDGLADVNLAALMDHYRFLSQPGKPRTTVALTAAHPPSRFGTLRIEEGRAKSFNEKPQTEIDWISAGFFVIEPEIFRLIGGDDTRFEYDVLPALAYNGRLGAYCHPGYFQMIDTHRDLMVAREMWETGKAPWARTGAGRH